MRWMWLAVFLSFSVAATDILPVQELQPELIPEHYLARIELNSPNEVHQALKRADMLFMAGSLKGSVAPAQFILHGPEVAIFFKDSYKEHKELLDLAARLTAFGVLEIRVCETRMGVMGRDPNGLLPFVGTVPFGPAEIERLMTNEKFIYF